MSAAAAPAHGGMARLARLLALLVAVLTLAGTALTWWLSMRTQQDAQVQMLARTEQRAMQLADAMAGQMDALLAGVDVALQQLRRAWLEGSPQDFDERARAVVATLPAGAVSHVTVVGADGQTLYNSLGKVETVNVADREHFRVHLDGSDRLHVGTAVRSRLAGGRWTFIVNRPLLQDGRFAGTVNVSVPAEFIAARLAGLALSGNDVVALVARDGSFLARSRDLERAMGRSLPPDRPFLVDRSAERGLFRVPGEVDGIARIYGWRRLPTTGLVSAVGLSEDDALAPLTMRSGRERFMLLALTAAAVLFGAAIAVLLWQSARRQLALERSERRYRMLLDSAPDAIFVTHSGRFRYLNPAALKLFGADDPAQLLGSPVMDRIHPDSHAAVEQRRRRLLGERLAVPPLAERYLRLDGSVVDVEVTAAPYADERGLSTQVVVRDISERRQAERALKQLNDELEQRVEERTAALRLARDEAEAANRAKSEFLSRMSHELRTPLNAILGFGQLLELESARDARTAGRVREILAAGRHLLTLINEVLDLARIEAGQMEVSLEPVPLGPLLADCGTLVQPLAAARGVSLELPDPAGVAAAAVRADRTRLKQVLLNLLGNAVKYNREGGGVRVTLHEDGDGWRVAIADDGPGLDAAQQARLFRPFERLDAAAAGIEGTGIGLAISRRLVELMHGSIGVASAPGQGSVFWIRLPRARDAAAAALPAGDGGDALAGAPPAMTSDRCVLYIEDNPSNLRLVEDIVAMRPRWRLCAADTPAAGLTLARTLRPDLVLLDIHLPEMDGFAVLRALREDPALRGTPVVAVSANAMPSDLARGEAAGFDDYLTKPLVVARLLALLDRHAGGVTAAAP
ncbi:MAG: PAS domain S-box protein [Rubrivivax sp.]|nr:PAS domain S-box protein [Rubrivivax sp.]